MSGQASRQTGLTGGGTWPSKTNPSGPDAGAQPAENDRPFRAKWWSRRHDLVDEWDTEAPERAARPVSVREGTTLREEATAEKSRGGLRSRPWSAVLSEFLKWYNDYRTAHLRFRNPEGEVVRSPLKNSHQPAYADTYYARLQALEREFLREADDAHLVMLTLTASHKNDTGGWRCPADHLRDIIESWSNNVRPALHRALGANGADVDRWEYARVVEHHPGSGYGHLHVAVFVDGSVTEKDFHGAIDAHLRNCDPAGADAHDYFAAETEARPISLKDADNTTDGEEDLASAAAYISSYIGAYGAELFDRDIEELAFRSVAWATGTNRVDLSNGAQELVSRREERLDGPDREERASDPLEEIDLPSGDFDPNDDDVEIPPDVDPLTLERPSWTCEGVGRVDPDDAGEEVFEIHKGASPWESIDGAEHLDTPVCLSGKPPIPPQAALDGTT